MAKREFLPALRRKLETKGLAERVRASTSGYLVPGIPYRTGWNAKRATEEAYQGNPLVYRAIEVICTNAIAQPVVLYQDDPDEGRKISRIRDDPTRLLYVLNRRANPWETGKIFRHRLVAQYLLFSKGVYIEVIRTRGGRIGMLNLLDPDLVSPIPSTTDPMASFEVRTPNSSVQSVNYLPRYDPRDPKPASILWIRSPHPLVMWQGMSPVQAAGLSIDLDHYARLYNRRFLQNDGRPGGLLSVKGAVSKSTMELIQSQFTGGPESAGRTTVIQADSISYADTSGSPRDLMWGELSSATKEEISMVFGVPASVMGDASGETFDNADADFAMFWEHRMKTLLMLLDDQLDILTEGSGAAGFDDDLFLRHDLSGVWVLGRHEREQQDRAAADLERGAITIDDYREATGRERLDVPATRVLWVPVGKMAVAEPDRPGDAEQAVANPIAAPGLGVAPGLGEPDAGAAALEPAPTASLRLLAGGRQRVDEPDTDLERASLLDAAELEGKQGGPRPSGSGVLAGAADPWR